MDPRIIHDLTHLADDLAPASMLLVCAEDSPLPEAIHTRHPDMALTWLFTEHAYEALEELERFEVVLLTDAVTRLAQAEATHLIARARDLHSESLYVLAPEPSGGGWPQEELVALGLTRERTYAHPDGATHLYRFNLKDYKKTPDWLNPRYWANPEMWGKARW
jgi:hypothetical protein